MKPRKAGIKKLIMPAHSSYAQVSADQAAIDKYLKEHGARQAVNTGKIMKFNGWVGGSTRHG